MPSSFTQSWYSAADGLWRLVGAVGEFSVRGNPQGPDPDRFELAGRVASHIAAFVAEANDYLAAFVVPERFRAFGPWEFDGAEFGIDPNDPIQDFELVLMLGNDLYGRWSVRFRPESSNPDRFYPYQFGRRQA